MELNYRQKPNGMYILNKGQMDDIAEMLLREYAPSALEHAQPVDIYSLAEEGLFLDLQYKPLTLNGSILGMTVFEDSEISYFDEMLHPTTATHEAATVLIHSGLRGNKHLGRRRFTVAHECSHWVLHRSYHSPTNQKYTLRTQRFPYFACRADAPLPILLCSGPGYPSIWQALSA